MNSADDASYSSSQPENGFIDSASLVNSEEAIQELLRHTPVHDNDDHLIEFSEALRTVAKALRRAAEGKASSQAEAAEWKRKYELERARKRDYQQQDKISGGKHDDGVHSESTHNLDDRNDLCNQTNKQPERCCAEHGICSHEVLFNGQNDSASRATRMMRKASFKLSWRCKGERNDQHKHDIVSFEKGNITTAGRTSKQIALEWESPPQTVLIMTKPNSNSVRVLCGEIVRWLKDHKNLNIYVEPNVRSELLTDSSTLEFVQTWQDESEILDLHKKVDLVVTLGGDGTVLWCYLRKGKVIIKRNSAPIEICIAREEKATEGDATRAVNLYRDLKAASMFKGPVPPIVPFSLGSLGFMTPFYSEHYKEHLNSILKGPISITLRHRLLCRVVRDSARNDYETEEQKLVLNEVTIDRGISSYLTNLECYCDNSFVTLVQGDGLILSTTSGSTAYSLAAGGSMVHPQVPGILFTPICPHSLSFRPLILPEHVTVRVQVPFNSRAPAWASFDGKDRKELAAGDALICRMAPWPVPTACLVDSTSDFLRSIHDGLHWNLRKTQSFDGPREQ